MMRGSSKHMNPEQENAQKTDEEIDQMTVQEASVVIKAARLSVPEWRLSSGQERRGSDHLQQVRQQAKIARDALLTKVHYQEAKPTVQALKARQDATNEVKAVQGAAILKKLENSPQDEGVQPQREDHRLGREPPVGRRLRRADHRHRRRRRRGGDEGVSQGLSHDDDRPSAPHAEPGGGVGIQRFAAGVVPQVVGIVRRCRCVAVGAAAGDIAGLGVAIASLHRDVGRVVFALAEDEEVGDDLADDVEAARRVGAVVVGERRRVGPAHDREARHDPREAARQRDAHLRRVHGGGGRGRTASAPC